MQDNKTTNPVGRPKSEEKSQQILTAAVALFLQQGFSATSMAMVSKASGVSKQTVYSHFENKESLFSTVIKGKCQEYQLDLAAIDANRPVDAVLRELGHQYLELLHDENVVSMYRVVIAESKHNPQVAELFYKAGPERASSALADYLEHHFPRQLSREEAEELAMAFFNLLNGRFHFRSLIGLDYALSDTEKDRLVNRALSMIAV